MVAYEISLIVKSISKPKIVSAVKRSADFILANGGFIEKIEFLGAKDMPYRILNHDIQFSTGSYFTIHHHGPPELRSNIRDFCKRDLDLIRSMVFEKGGEKQFTCTLHDEIKPPAHRPEVQKMIKEMKERTPIPVRKGLKNRALNTGLDYNPF